MKASFHPSIRTISAVATILAAGALTGCSFGPIADVTSLSPAIQGSAVDNETAFADASDQILLTNILRARDHAPLNMGALASISGALSLSGTAGFSVPFHVGQGAKGTAPSSTTSQDSFAPSITGSTSPTYSFSPLNTQGFMLNAVQPVSASYVLNRWDAGLSRETLLLLFAKEIDFPVDVETDASIAARAQAAKEGKTTPKPVMATHFARFINDPDEPNRMKAFMALVDALLASDANLRAFDVLDPVGPQFDLYQPSNVSGGGTNPPLTASTDQRLVNQPNATSFGFFTGNNDGQYHTGNALTRDDKKAIQTFQGQLYRVYAAQVALCVNQQNMANAGYPVPDAMQAATESDVVPEAVTRAGVTEEQWRVAKPSRIVGDAIAQLQSSAPQFNTALMTNTASLTGGSPKSNTSGAAAPATGGSGSATTAALQAQRFSSIVDDTGCGSSQIVLAPSDEREFVGKAQKFVHIEWRSLYEMFEYLGANLRYGGIGWNEKAALWVATGDQTADNIQEKRGMENCDAHSCRPMTLFEVHEGLLDAGAGHPSAEYRGQWYSVAHFDNKAGDQSMVVLSMLSTLVNLANQSSVTTSAPFQLLPLP